MPAPLVLGRDELLLVAASIAATLTTQKLLSQCCLSAAPPAGGNLLRRSQAQAGTEEIRPPFPASVVALLHSSALCYLSTLADGAPHLSLMNFTYCQTEEKIIMSTRRDTTKFTALLSLPRVALLLHDFPDQHSGRGGEAPAGGGEDSYGRTFSITLYGNVTEEEGAEAERLRAMHLQRHGPSMKQFICGENVAIISVNVDKARICNDKDKVTEWAAPRSPRSNGVA
jgi:hypothetical protein